MVIGSWRIGGGVAMLAALAVAGGCGGGTSDGESDLAAPPVDASMAAPRDLRSVDLGPCGGPCTSPTPLCDPGNGRCVACLADKDCAAGQLCHAGACAPGCTLQHGCGDAGVCQSDGGVCLECLGDADCARLGDKARPVCDPRRGACVACRAAPDTCGAGSYCRDDGQGNLACAAGCKVDAECQFADGGGASMACCNHACVDTATSLAHCGQCGAACNQTLCCAGVCFDGTSSLDHCGACGNKCPSVANAIPRCAAGVCGSAGCNMGFADCDKDPKTGCEASLGSDIANCGQCGTSCALPHANVACIAGGCALASCVGGYRNCDGQAANGCEIDAANDNNNCGQCGNRCLALPHASAACSMSACRIQVCDAGYANCDNMDANGCEATLASDGKNCGKCGNSCPQPANLPYTCVNSMCVTNGCNAGFADCDKNVNNGCEAKLATDPNNCGACGVVCNGNGANAFAACLNSACTLGCNQGWGNCDGNNGNGCEANLTNDNKNCGACATVCNNGQTCTNGVCTDAVLSFDFEENGGAQVVDASGYHNDGTLFGNWARVPGRTGNGIKLDGSSYITVPDAMSLNPQAITFELWVKLDNCNGIQDFMGKDLWDLNGGRQYLINLAGNRFRVHALVKGVFNYFDGVTPCVANTWFHLAETYDGTTLTLYVNGKVDAQKNYAGPLESTNTVFAIGQQASGNYRVYGIVDTVRVFPYARSANDIAQDAR